MTKNTIKRLSDGNYEVTITFDITEHGHDHGMPRNYSLKKVQQLVNSDRVQADIANGYAVCMYGHGARHQKQGYRPKEHNFESKDVQEPIGKVTSLSIYGKKITWTALLVETDENKTKSVAKLIESNIGGFSFVWDLKYMVFYGADFVLSPNFNGNRVVMDSICGDGECTIDNKIDTVVLDVIGNHDDLFEEAKDLLVHQDTVMSVIKVKDRFSALIDSVESLQSQLEEKQTIIENKDIDINAEKAEKSSLEKQLSDTIKKAEEALELNTEKDERVSSLESEIENLNKLLGEYGIMQSENDLSLDPNALGALVLNKKEKFNKDVDQTIKDSLKSRNGTHRTDAYAHLNFSYGKQG